MNELTKEKLMSTKELAEVLGVGESTIKRVANKLSSVVGGVSRNNQGGYLFTEEQATTIKQEIQKHHNLANRQIDTVSTEIEENQLIENALTILRNRNNELKKRAEIAEQKLIEQAPKVDFYNCVALSPDTIDMGEVAKVLNCGLGRNRLFELLRNKHILTPNNQPYQRYVDSGYFRIVETKFALPDGTIKISLKTEVYQRGLDFIRKVIKGE